MCKVSIRKNIVLNDGLIAQAMAKAQVRTKKDAVEAALLADLCKLGYSGLLALERSDVLIKDYDPKAFFIHPRYAEPSFFIPLLPGRSHFGLIRQPAMQSPTPRNANDCRHANVGGVRSPY